MSSGSFKNFTYNCLFSSIRPIDWTVSGATTPGQSGPGSDGNEGVLHIPHSSSITGTLPSDYPGHSGGGGVLPLCKETGGAFYNTSQLGNTLS